MLAIGPQLDAIAAHLVVRPATLVGGAICIGVFTDAFLLPMLVLSFENRSLLPLLDTFPMLLVIFPESLVASPLDTGIGTHTIGSIVHPLPIVDITCYMIEFTLSESRVHLPFPFICGAISPFHGAFAMPHTALPLASVYCT